jgi:RNase P/RNase MRP subunit POP5
MIYRRKQRHILVEASSEINLADKRVEDDLKARLRGFLGEIEYFKSNPQVSAQLNGNVFILSVNRGYERNAILALSFIKDFKKERIGFCTIKTSGTIKSLKEYFAKVY